MTISARALFEPFGWTYLPEQEFCDLSQGERKLLIAGAHDQSLLDHSR